MKMTRLLFTIVVCGGLLCESTFADSIKRGPEPRSIDGRAKAIGGSAGAGQRSGAGASDKNGKSAHPEAIRPAPKLPASVQNRPGQKPAARGLARIPSGTSLNVRQAAPIRQYSVVKPGGAPNKELLENKIAVNHSSATRTPGGVALAGSSFIATRRRAPEPAALGGPMISSARSNSSLNGTAFRKRGQ
jgi:hypothetical protein